MAAAFPSGLRRVAPHSLAPFPTGASAAAFLASSTSSRTSQALRPAVLLSLLPGHKQAGKRRAPPAVQWLAAVAGAADQPPRGSLNHRCRRRRRESWRPRAHQ
ncbi:hypothetical protein GUJ93_ZPchr0009g1703 [Zizania palustris]|uniref:Uncharacterized protein n=1 Tax=Zizania palustris TaxID=103762 RepID=A0A8J5RAX1_ZIZPA|nr:hypothetical protein GUJ93_ZPchr0009g1703 [Zizania palustris]